MSKTIYIGGRLESKEKGNVVTGANAILDDTKGKKQNVINKETDDELLRLEQSKQDNLNFDNAPTENSTNPVTSGGVYTAEKALSDAIEAILLLIPSAATALNKLVDTNTMNSSISTATATFRGTYNAVSDLGLTYQATHAQIEAALDALGLTADNNDFAFVQIPVSDQSQDIAKTERFKFNGTNWLYEYDLNTSGFTAAQWAAINSGITVALVTKLTDLPTAAALQLALNGKQDTLTFDNEPTALSQNPVTSGGIYLAIQAVATALSNYSTATDNRLNTLEGLVPTEASSSNKLTDKAYVDGLIQAITELIPAEADTTNQLADKAYVLAQILAATPAFKGQYVTLAELQAVASPKAGDLGIVRTKDSDGMDVFTVYQYLNNAWNVFYSLSYHPQTKPATTGTTGDYPYNGMGRVELAKNIVNGVNTLTQDMFYKGPVGSRVPNTNTIFVIRYDYVLAENITIPDACVLKFEGGSISGAYTITGANTGINAGLVKIFNTNVTLAGSWNVEEAYPEWFGILPNDITANLGGINDSINAFNTTVIYQEGTYYSNTPVHFIKAKGNETIINVTVSENGGYASFAGNITQLTDPNARKFLSIENIYVSANSVSALESASVIYVGSLSAQSLIKNCRFVNNITGTVTKEERYNAIVNDDTSIERRFNRGMTCVGTSELVDIENTFFRGPISVCNEGGLDFFCFKNCIFHASGIGYCCFYGGGNALSFIDNSYDIMPFVFKSHDTYNGLRICGGRSEQTQGEGGSTDNLIVDPVTGKTINAFFYFKESTNDKIVNASINDLYIDGYANGIYIEAARMFLTFTNIYYNYPRSSANTQYCVKLVKTSSEISHAELYNCNFSASNIVLTGFSVEETAIVSYEGNSTQNEFCRHLILVDSSRYTGNLYSTEKLYYEKSVCSVVGMGGEAQVEIASARRYLSFNHWSLIFVECIYEKRNSMSDETVVDAVPIKIYIKPDLTIGNIYGNDTASPYLTINDGKLYFNNPGGIYAITGTISAMFKTGKNPLSTRLIQ